MSKPIAVLVVTLLLCTGCNAQLGGLLGAVANAVGSVAGSAANVVDTAASVVADNGFNLGWWNNGNVVLYNLAVANAQISTQGCTPFIYGQVVNVHNGAYDDGYGPAFVDAFGNINTVGPGLFHCWNGDYGPIYTVPARQWAIANGYIFGRRSLNRL